MTDKNFFEGLSSIFDIFGDVTLSEMAEKIMNNIKEGKSYSTYKSKTWTNGKCTDEVEKEWVDGKLVKDEGFNSIENVIKDDTAKVFMTEVCHCCNSNENKNTDKCYNDECKCECHKEESLQEYTNKQLLEENEALKSKIKELNFTIENLKDKNKYFYNENKDLKAKLENIKKCLLNIK